MLKKLRTIKSFTRKRTRQLKDSQKEYFSWRGLNPRPIEFQSIALPTELQPLLRLFKIIMLFVQDNIFFINKAPNKFSKPPVLNIAGSV